MPRLAAALDAGAILAELEATQRRRRAAEVDDLRLVFQHAHLHTTIPADTAPGGATLGDLGGDGTPGVSDLAIVELGVARGVHTHAARSVVADSLDLHHRLPHTWEALESLDAEVWLARRVARISRHLSLEVVGLVDRAVAAAITGESPARVIELAEAKVIEADRAAHEAKVAAERLRRFVGVTRPDAHGHRTVIARVTSSDAAEVMATVQEVADLLARRREHADLGADALRAEAFAWLARPEDVEALRAAETDPRRHRRQVVLYLHLHEAAVGASGGVARVEGVGPHTLAQLAALLGHHHVTVKPVIDLAERVSVSAYEHPDGIKERIHLLWGRDAFPHGTTSSRFLDHDHIRPFDPDGPPDQTGSHTSQPLGRTGHRAKTHEHYGVHQTETGEVLWATPHGRHRAVDETGTHDLTAEQHRQWTTGDAYQRALARVTHRVRTGAIPS